MPLNPPRRPTKFSSQLRGSENFSGSGTAFQAQKPSYGPANCIKGFPNIEKAAENLAITERFPGGGGGAESPR